MKNKKHIFIPLFVFLGALIVGLVWSIIDFTVVNPSKNYAYETVQFNYDGASDGVDPDGNQFNPVAFLSDEIIADGLNRSNMATTYKVEDVRKNIVMENVVPEDIVDEVTSYTKLIGTTSSTRDITTKDYHPVRYRFALYRDLDPKLSVATLNGLLDSIVTAYCDTFHTTYMKRFDTADYDQIYTLDNYDYIYQTEVYTNKLNILASSAKSLYNEHTEFVAENNKSFNDIVLKSNQLISNDVARINNLIALKALSKDVERLKNFYSYKIEMLNFEKTKNTSDLTAINAQIAAYSKDSTIYVPSGDSVIKVDGNGSETYDSLLKRQLTLSDNISAINVEINEYQSILDDITAGTGSEADYNLVKSYIAKLIKDYDALDVEYKAMIDQYNAKYIANGTISRTSVKYQGNSIASASFALRFAKIGGSILLIACFGICVFGVVYQIRKNKKAVV